MPNRDPEEPGPFRAHHGSISLDERRATEEALKQGELKAVVATASLELGIDMGAVDLVCQVESPGNVARGLQRVGRAGHVVRGISKGRLIAKTPADLLESAALCRSMLAGEIEHLRVPLDCLDVLAQQVVACVAMEPWDVPALFDLVRAAYPFHNLSAESFESVLRLISGRFPTPDFRDLRAQSRLGSGAQPTGRAAGYGPARPGGRRARFPDTGQFPVYLGEGGPRLGELDEEFVYERRVGESFVLGNSTWRITAIEPHRVVVAEGRGAHRRHAILARGERGSLARAGRGCRSALPRGGRAARRPAIARLARTGMPADCRGERIAAIFHLAPAPARRRGARRSHDRGRDVRRPGGRAWPGGAHAVRRAAAPRAQTRPRGANPRAIRAELRPVCMATTVCCSACRRWPSRRSTFSTA